MNQFHSHDDLNRLRNELIGAHQRAITVLTEERDPLLGEHLQVFLDAEAKCASLARDIRTILGQH